ncbi:MAG: type II toxin-antitoxin system HicA family toxin [Candidatus Eremiobacterota bacterium]
MRVREIISRIEADGWYQVGQKGSHRQFKHPAKRGRVTVSGNPGDDVTKANEHSILKQAGLK